MSVIGWRTINGSHVFLQGGTITKGNKAIIGMKPSELNHPTVNGKYVGGKSSPSKKQDKHQVTKKSVKEKAPSNKSETPKATPKSSTKVSAPKKLNSKTASSAMTKMPTKGPSTSKSVKVKSASKEVKQPKQPKSSGSKVKAPRSLTSKTFDVALNNMPVRGPHIVSNTKMRGGSASSSQTPTQTKAKVEAPRKLTDKTFDVAMNNSPTKGPQVAGKAKVTSSTKVGKEENVKTGTTDIKAHNDNFSNALKEVRGGEVQTSKTTPKADSINWHDSSNWGDLGARKAKEVLTPEEYKRYQNYGNELMSEVSKGNTSVLSSKPTGNSIASIEAQKGTYSMKDYEGITFEAENYTPNRISVQDLIKEKGYDAKPKVLSEQEFQQHLESGGVNLARGISGKDAQKYAEEFKNGEFYVNGGEAYYGEGMYTFGGKDASNASSYAYNGGVVMEMSLAKDAKIYNVEGYGGVNTKVLSNYFDFEMQPDIGGQHSGVKRTVKPEKKAEVDYVKDMLQKYTDNITTQDKLGEKYRKMGYDIPKKMGIEDVRSGDHYLEDLLKLDAHNKEVDSLVKKAGIQELKKAGILSKEQMKLAKALTDPSHLSTEELVKQGYDAVRFSSDYVKGSSKNPGEIYVVLNRGKVVMNSNVKSQGDYIKKNDMEYGQALKKQFKNKGIDVHNSKNWGKIAPSEARHLLSESELKKYWDWRANKGFED